MHPAEDINKESLLEEAIRTYVAKGIGDLYRLSLTEFLELPIDIVQMLITIASEEQHKKKSAMDEAEKAFKG